MAKRWTRRGGKPARDRKPGYFNEKNSEAGRLTSVFRRESPRLRRVSRLSSVICHP